MNFPQAPVEYIIAVELYQIRHSIINSIDLSAGSISQSNESAVLTFMGKRERKEGKGVRRGKGEGGGRGGGERRK